MPLGHPLAKSKDKVQYQKFQILPYYKVNIIVFSVWIKLQNFNFVLIYNMSILGLIFQIWLRFKLIWFETNVRIGFYL